MSAISYKKEYYEAVMQFLWRQWVNMGIAGHTSAGSGSAYTADPEALILFTSAFCRYEQRLYDLMASWMQEYSHVLNPSRMKSMLEKAEYKDEASIAYLAHLCTQAGDTRWKRAAAFQAQDSPQAMFYSSDTGKATFCPKQDKAALRYGLIRPPFEPQRKHRELSATSSATLLLTLRGLLGVTARAEITLLLMTGACTIKDITERSGFARNAVTSVLEEMELVNLISRIKHKSALSVFTMVNKGLLSGLTEEKPVIFPHWATIFQALGKIWQLLTLPNIMKVTDTCFIGELNRLFKKEVWPLMLNCGVRELENLNENAAADFPRVIASI